jgi:hypothetical protein
MNRWPQSWAGRAVWLMLTVSACWVAYQVATLYGACRLQASGKISCLLEALFGTYAKILVMIIAAAAKILSVILP